MANLGVVVACKTYRKVVKKTAKALRVDPTHTRYPSEDFDRMLEVMDEKSRERAMKFYRLGLRRGFDEATTAVADGKLYFEKEELICPEEVIITANIKFKDQDRRTVEFKFTADDLGFK